MARRWTLSALALAAALATGACAGDDLDTGRSNEDTGMEGTTDATPGNTLDGGAGVTPTVSADTSTPKTATGPAAPQTDSARNVTATAAGPRSVQVDSASGGAPGAGQPVATQPTP